MNRIRIVVILSLIFTTYAVQAVEQTAFSGAGVIESTAGGFRFPDGSMQTSAGLGDLVCAAGEIAKFDGAYWVCAADNDTDLSAQVTELQALVATLQSELSATQAALTANSVADASAHHDKYTDAEAIAAVGPHSPDLTDLLAGVSRIIDPNTGYDTIQFSGMNVQVVNGTETTNNEPDGTGNLIIGYNELREAGDDRTGSHMLVIGKENNYSSYGGMVVGHGNAASGLYSSVSGGAFNTASGDNTSVSGGQYNTASEESAAVSGGYYNTASGPWSSVSGGHINTASSAWSSVSGGISKTADSEDCTVAGNVGTDCTP